jgi:hypothetical protein
LPPEAQTVRGFVCGEIDRAVEYAGKSFDEVCALNTANLIWPYEKMLRQSRVWPGLRRELILRQTRRPGVMFR